MEKSLPNVVTGVFIPDVNLMTLFLKDPQGAFPDVKKAASEGNGFALYLMALYYSNGYNTVEINEKKAKKYFSDSVKAGYMPRTPDARNDDTKDIYIYILFSRLSKTFSSKWRSFCFGCFRSEVYAWSGRRPVL